MKKAGQKLSNIRLSLFGILSSAQSSLARFTFIIYEKSLAKTFTHSLFCIFIQLPYKSFKDTVVHDGILLCLQIIPSLYIK